VPTKKKDISLYRQVYPKTFERALRTGSARLEFGSKSAASSEAKEFYNYRALLRETAVEEEDADLLRQAARFESVRISQHENTLILWNVNAETFV
jgi:hypothetical protein